jgi:hypothetical protein
VQDDFDLSESGENSFTARSTSRIGRLAECVFLLQCFLFPRVNKRRILFHDEKFNQVGIVRTLDEDDLDEDSSDRQFYDSDIIYYVITEVES